MRIIEVIQIRKATPHFRTRYRCKKTRNNQTSQKLQENLTRRKKRTKYLPKTKKKILYAKSYTIIYKIHMISKEQEK